MRMTQIINQPVTWILLAVAIIGTAIGAFNQDSNDKNSKPLSAQAPTPSPDQPALAREKIPLDGLQDELRSLRQRLKALEIQRRLETQKEESAEESHQEAALAAPTLNEAQTFLFSAHASQDLDVEWAHARETELFEYFDQTHDFPGSALTAAECRNSMCRLDVEHNEEADAEHFREAMLDIPVLKTEMFFLTNEDGSRTVIYSARQGHGLPRLTANAGG